MKFAAMYKILAVPVAVAVLYLPVSSFAANGDLMVSGNVGVGTTTPQANVDVAGDIHWATNKGVLSTLNGNPSMGTSTNLPLLLMTNGTERLRVDENGRIGVGINSPTNRVHISETLTDPSVTSSAVQASTVIKATSSGTYGGRGGMFTVTTDIPSGLSTNSAWITGIETSATRNKTTDTGSVDFMLGGLISFGHTGTTNRTTNHAWGQTISLYNSGGTISDATALYIRTPTNVGNIISRYGIYVEDTLMVNYFAGNVGIGTTNPAYKLQVNGSFAATSKNFDIPDPRYHDHKMRLIHASIEGPENAVYYRGETKLIAGKAVVNLPDYFESLTRRDNRSVQLTAAFESEDDKLCLVAASAVRGGAFIIKAYGVSDPELCNHSVYWEVKAERSDIDRLKVESRREESAGK